MYVKNNNDWEKAKIVRKHDAPRSYVTLTENNRLLRRNRRHMIELHHDFNLKPVVYFDDKVINHKSVSDSNEFKKSDKSENKIKINDSANVSDKNNVNPNRDVKDKSNVATDRPKRNVKPNTRFKDFVMY